MNTIKILVLFIMSLFFSQICFAACDPLWVDNGSKIGNAIYKDLVKLSKFEKATIIATPKAVKLIEDYSDPSLMLHQLEILDLPEIKLIISNTCDKELIEKLSKANVEALNNYPHNGTHFTTLAMKGVEIAALISSFSRMCNIPIEMSNGKDSIRTWIMSSSKITCSTLPTLLAAHGIEVIKRQNKLVAKKAGVNNNIGGATLFRVDLSRPFKVYTMTDNDRKWSASLVKELKNIDNISYFLRTSIPLLVDGTYVTDSVYQSENEPELFYIFHTNTKVMLKKGSKLPRSSYTYNHYRYSEYVNGSGNIIISINYLDGNKRIYDNEYRASPKNIFSWGTRTNK